MKRGVKEIAKVRTSYYCISSWYCHGGCLKELDGGNKNVNRILVDKASKDVYLEGRNGYVGTI
jgi:hypothetical protein